MKFFIILSQEWYKKVIYIHCKNETLIKKSSNKYNLQNEQFYPSKKSVGVLICRNENIYIIHR